MLKTPLWVLICVLALPGGVGSSVAQTNASIIVPGDKIQGEMASTNWQVRMHLAERLSSDHTEGTFRVLLILLTDKSEDVSYAAAESIEVRKDKAFDRKMIDVIRSLPRDECWAAYRAAKNYPTPAMFIFLQKSLDDEMRFQNKRTAFDSRNCFYISRSLEEIVRSLKMAPKVKAPDDDDQKAYERFAEELRQVR